MNMLLIKKIVSKILPHAHIIEASNGEKALALTLAHEPDLILMDVHMPVMDGIEATSRIREREAENNRKTPIIALTAGAFTDDKENCIEAGMDDFLTKPVNKKLLAETLQKHLRLNGTETS